MTDCIQDTLACIRSAVDSMLSGTAVIYAYNRSADGIGGGTAVYTPSGTAACRIVQDTKPREALFGSQIVSFNGWIITLPYTTEVRPQDRIVSDNKTYEVIGVNDGETLAISRRAVCRRLDP